MICYKQSFGNFIVTPCRISVTSTIIQFIIQLLDFTVLPRSQWDRFHTQILTLDNIIYRYLPSIIILTKTIPCSIHEYCSTLVGLKLMYRYEYEYHKIHHLRPCNRQILILIHFQSLHIYSAPTVHAQGYDLLLYVMVTSTVEMWIKI